MSKQSDCPKCGRQMVLGYILDEGEVGCEVRRISHWVSGEPESSFWMGLKTGDRDVLGVHTFRCTGCGYLESYANK